MSKFSTGHNVEFINRAKNAFGGLSGVIVEVIDKNSHLYKCDEYIYKIIIDSCDYKIYESDLKLIADNEAGW